MAAGLQRAFPQSHAGWLSTWRGLGGSRLQGCKTKPQLSVPPNPFLIQPPFPAKTQSSRSSQLLAEGGARAELSGVPPAASPSSSPHQVPGEGSFQPETSAPPGTTKSRNQGALEAQGQLEMEALDAGSASGSDSTGSLWDLG